jgi:hypothetical protein
MTVNTIVDPRELQRLRYRPGQDLLSRDFRDQSRFDDQLRWWHNRAMHNAFGVRIGLTVHVVIAADQARANVEPGVAYDSFGRELILPRPTSVPIPVGPDETEPRLLVIRYRRHKHDRAADALTSICCDEPTTQHVELSWVPQRRVRPSDGVPLARVLYFEGEPLLDDQFDAPIARALARPRLGSGSTVLGATKWEIWDLGGRPSFLLTLQLPIDTHAAGFTEPPCYFAWIQGGLETRFDPAGPTFLLPLYSHLDAETLTGFRVRVVTFALNKRMGAVGSRNALLSLARQKLTVGWLGIQMPSAGDALSEVMHGHS